MFKKEPDIIIGWCGYCKNAVFEDEKFQYEKQTGKYYHQFCYEQKYFFEHCEGENNEIKQNCGTCFYGDKGVCNKNGGEVGSDFYCKDWTYMMIKSEDAPRCIGSNPSPQGKAENDCFTCDWADICNELAKGE